MAFVDQIKIRAKAGNGGNGVVRWLHEYQREFGGPSGGDGGKGGDVIFRGVRDLMVLAAYKGRGAFKAKNGDAGGGKNMAGKDGADIVIDVPVGAVMTRQGTGETFEIMEEGGTVVALHGGRGGIGNARFKSSTNQYPDEATPGRAGEEDVFLIELRIIADVGLVGLPNAGKSSLLNALTNAEAKVGAYAFTTLEPNLGVFYGYVIADIPGLIEGASTGRGLGHDFLRHISRTKVIVHCVASDSENPFTDYETVREELRGYSDALSQKPEIIFLTKADMRSPEEISSLQARFRERNSPVVAVSVIDDALLKEVGDELVRFLRSK